MSNADPTLGPNSWLVDEMLDRWRNDPSSVDAQWQSYFSAHPGVIEGEVVSSGPAVNGGAASAPTTPTAPEPAAEAQAEPTAPAPAPEARPEPTPAAPAAKAPPEPATPEVEEPGVPLRGAAARIVVNMEASLSVPTATSYRQVPSRLLEVNRSVINGYLTRIRKGKVSFTHLIGYAVIKATGVVPGMRQTFVEGSDGSPRVIKHDHIGLGIAVDVEKSDGSRSLLVPVVKQADTLGFSDYREHYEALIAKVRDNKLAVDDFSGATHSLTNVGTIGTLQSVPRLMPGQAAIIGVGAMAYPAEFAGADPVTLADLGISKVLTISNTYDHRVVQGAESGLFLSRVEQLLLGQDGFYDEIFADLGVPYEPVRWRQDKNPVDREGAFLHKQMQVRKIVQMYRVRGHLIADLDPLRMRPPLLHRELDPSTYGLTIWDNDREFLTDDLPGPTRMKFGDILHELRDAYCRTVGVEYMHISDPDEKAWIQQHVEGSQPAFSRDEVVHIMRRLNAADAFETFLHKRYVGHKRFGVDGGESVIPLLDAILERAADDERTSAVVMGMAHRGRLNVLFNIVGKPLSSMFREFEGTISVDSVQGSGDVKYHLGQRGTYVSRAGSELDIELAANPSHLEAVGPVVVGMVRARQDQIDPPEAFPVLPLLVHGDAAFAGQGVVAETLNMGKIPGFRVGGAVHVVINNQVGYTTLPSQARSSEYATDVAKTVQAPIFHVNGNDPEACVRVARLAYEYRQQFNKDVVIDMLCYRRHGHNEGDDPSYTQPLMYQRIDQMPPARQIYADALIDRGEITPEDAEHFRQDYEARLQAALDETRAARPPEQPRARVASVPAPPPQVNTGVSRAVLDRVHAALNDLPEGFTLHPKLAKQFDGRSKMFTVDAEVDFGLAESFAYGSLLLEGTSVRLTGQDSRRGTFAHRHAVYRDYYTEGEYTPLYNLDDGQGRFWIYDSVLSEYAALAFEYGYATQRPDMLVAWEAQFGDFVNGAQIVIDQFIAASEDKWNQRSGLVMLLPHGFEGQGPEHSSARVERFLILSAENNMCVANASTAGQFFHLIRRQIVGRLNRPLIVFTPKSLLRAKVARSPVESLVSGTFHEVLDDPTADPSTVTTVVLCSGKIGHEAMQRRDALGAPVAVVRIEQMYPWPEDQIRDVLARYSVVQELVWLQEEPANMGGWNFAATRLWDMLDGSLPLRRASRPESGSPACGSTAVHQQEAEQLMIDVFGPPS